MELTVEEVIVEALEVIDKGLEQMLHRELVSAMEASDLLLDVRSLLANSLVDVDVDPGVPVTN